MKRPGLIFLSILLILSLAGPFGQPVKAAYQSSGPSLRILEIVAAGGTQLGNYLRGLDYEATTMTMKKFVSLREELDGKYDVIAIMQGNYTSTGVSGTNHNTTNVQNDITNLKAQEITQDFIEKGQPVIFYKDSITTGKNISANFSKYKTSRPGNVFLFDYTDLYFFGLYNDAGFKDYIKTGAYQQSPRYTLTQQPDKTKKYTPGEKINFTMNISVPADVKTRNLESRLYIDSNFNDKYTTDEVVAEKTITASSDSISYTLPKGYSGVRYWKLELIDTANNLKSYQKGKIYFIGKTVEVKVLQVTKNSSDISDLNKTMTKVNLIKTNEYKIAIDTVDIGTFNRTTYSTINGKYDMVIFGFSDMYNSTAISQGAVDELLKFIKSQQSIMFTHDTVFLEKGTSSNIWVKNFKVPTGQIEPLTNLGYGAPSTSTTAKKVNTALMTEYPYDLGDGNLTVALTHNQYYTLDLEDPEVIPWYNIIGSSRDENDSWNHYYTYSKGNITYSGTGHITSSNFRNGFPEQEQQLFVNTMYRAFLGSNHAPEITVLAPKENQVIPANQNIELSYILQDYDLKDNKLSTKVFVNDKQVFTKDNVTNGEAISASLPHSLPNGGTAVVRIQATDASGAISEKEVRVTVQKVTASLEVKREAPVQNPVRTGEPVTITYTVTPKDITGAQAEALKSQQTVTVSGLSLTEKFPAGMEVVSEGAKTGTDKTGITLVRNLPDVGYKKNGEKFTAEPITFSIQVTPNEKKQYVLNDSVLNYTDLTTKKETPAFNSITLDADVALKEISLPADYVVSKGTEKNFSIDLKLNPDNAGVKDIIWSEESGGTVLKIDSKTGTATVLQKGSTYVNVKVTDRFGNVKTARAHVTVRIPVEDFTLDEKITLNVGETQLLNIYGISDEAKPSLTLNLADESIARIDKENFKITGLKTGETILTVSGLRADGTKIEKMTKVYVNDVDVTRITVEPGNLSIKKNETYSDFKVKYEPENATRKDFIWTSLSPTIVHVLENGTIKGMATGTADIEVASKYDPDVKTTIQVKVGQPLVGIEVPDSITVEKNKTTTIPVGYVPSDATNVIGKSFSSSDDNYATVDQDGVITGVRTNKEDKVTVTVEVHDDAGNTFTKDVPVNIVNSIDDKTDGDKY